MAEEGARAARRLIEKEVITSDPELIKNHRNELETTVTKRQITSELGSHPPTIGGIFISTSSILE